MTHFRFFAITVAAVLAAASGRTQAQEGLSGYQAIVSVADQKIMVVRDGGVVAKYPISTSRFGVGDASGSYKTPLGKMKVCEKLGDNLPTGAVIKHRQATGEVIAVNAPGRDPIVTRVLWLDGTEPGNAHAKDRSIYIHGTPEEKNIGRPASYGCIRMRSQDVIALYQELGVGATVSVIPDKLPKLAKYEPPKPTPVPKVMPPPKVEVAKAAPTPAVAPKQEVAKVSAPAAPAEKPVPPTSPKVLAAIAEARDHESKFERQAMLDREKAEQDLRDHAAKMAKLDSPAVKSQPAPTTAKAGKTAAQPAPIASGPADAAGYNASRLATARKRLAEPQPVTVSTPVDQDRLQFLRNRDSNLASSGGESSSTTVDLVGRMKGSILESGLSR